MEYKREMQTAIEQQMFKGKVIIIYGARRVGKTYMSKQIIKNMTGSKYINCELLQYQTVLQTTNSELLKDFFGDCKIAVLDEAQHIRNIGMTLKIITDTFLDLQIIATGSSSFDLANQVSEPLTGRSRVFMLLPLSFSEICQKYDTPTALVKIPNLLRFGLYPDVFDKPENDAIEELMNIAGNYLYKDILMFENLKRPDLVLNLLKALAMQVGSEVSYNELANTMGENVHTIKRYIDLLEKNFVIFRLKSYSTNPRKEIAKGQKIFFYDMGILNTLINNYNSVSERSDAGGLWENFCISERIKFNQNKRNFVNTYFYRTVSQQEIDYIEEQNGVLNCYEFKYTQPKKEKIPKIFLENYPESVFKTIHNQNIFSFLK